jgi:DNA-binding CsgD family transcriptional regulator
VNFQKRLNASTAAREEFSVHPKTFIFVDRKTGTRRFEVKADPKGRLPVDQAVSLLVAHCLMRRQLPDDFNVMVATGENLLDGLRQIAMKLIQACPVIDASVRLTNRQEEVLREILRSLSNKEIAMKLNVSERTVKFHVSALLWKFGVDKRTSLILMAGDFQSSLIVPSELNIPQLVAGGEHGVGQEIRNSREKMGRVADLDRRSHR